MPVNNEKETISDEEIIKERLSRISKKYVVLSGKGGVGKSSVAVNFAASLAAEGYKVGLMDIDMHGPSIPVMLGDTCRPSGSQGRGIIPGEVYGMKVISVGYMLRNADDAVIWRGPMKTGAIKQFIKDVEWGDLDYLIIDSPPGTGDEPLSACQIMKKSINGALIVTTPQEVSASDVRKSINFCRQLELPVTGIIQNMGGFVCPECGSVTDIFKGEGGLTTAKKFDIPFLGNIPLDPSIVASGDSGKPFVLEDKGSEAGKSFKRIVDNFTSLVSQDSKNQDSKNQDSKNQDSEDQVSEHKKPEDKNKQNKENFNESEDVMKIALPVVQGQLSRHFGHCEKFFIAEVEASTGSIMNKTEEEPPPHEPGVLPAWLKEKGADLIIAGGMGNRAEGLFRSNGIDVVTGASSSDPVEKIISDYCTGKLATGDNLCDH